MTHPWLQPTSGEAEPVWVPNHRRRSTFDFLQTCILTLILCAWTAIHLNVPTPKSRDSWWRRAWDKVIWMIGAILAPEGLFVVAFRQYWEARQVCKSLLTGNPRGIRHSLDRLNTINESQKNPRDMENQQEEGQKTDVDTIGSMKTSISRTGLNTSEKAQPESVMTDHIEPMAPRQSAMPTDPTDLSSPKPTHLGVCRQLYRSIFPKNLELGFFIVMGGYEVVHEISNSGSKIALKLPKGRDPEQQQHEWWGTLTPRGALLLNEFGALPLQTTAQINDKSKANWLAKSLVCIQATWMLVQCTARKIAGLPITLLELNTVMHVICALLMYCLWLYKPLDVSVPVIITSDQIDKNNLIPRETKDLFCQGYFTKGRVRDAREGTVMHQHSGHKREYTIHRVRRNNSNRDQVGLYLGVLSSWVYGGVHLTPWASHFPTVLERMIWRASGLIIVGAPVVFATSALIRNSNRTSRDVSNIYFGNMRWENFFGFARSGKWGYFIYVLVLYFCALVYATARAYFVIEAFASLRSLPVGSYTSVNWVEMFPHL